MAEKIGYQDGITAMMNRLRTMDPDGTIVKKQSDGKWPKEPLEQIKNIPVDQWKAYDKAERAFSILAADHDAAVTNGGSSPLPPDPPDPPPVSYIKVAPRVAYADGGSDARYCCENQPGVVRSGSGWIDESGATYDTNGLCVNGLRSNGSPADCPTSARSIDGREYCSLPTQGDPTKQTGSWIV
jgi:hypothetical protein